MTKFPGTDVVCGTVLSTNMPTHLASGSRWFRFLHDALTVVEGHGLLTSLTTEERATAVQRFFREISADRGHEHLSPSSPAALEGTARRHCEAL